jgi:hypothetical protein
VSTDSLLQVMSDMKEIIREDFFFSTSTQDLDPRPLSNNDHPSVLPFEMYVIDPGEPPSGITNSGTDWTLSAMCLQQFSPGLVRRSFADMQSQVHDFTGTRLGGVPFGRHFRFGGSQS